MVKFYKFNGLTPRVVVPTPVFYGRKLKVKEGYVRTRDIKLWSENKRIDIHLRQFHEKFGRDPDENELYKLMLNVLPELDVNIPNQFKIIELADSIVVNGVKIPPIIDYFGNLLDGNRRITACHYILKSRKFSEEEKKHVKFVHVWQLQRSADDNDKQAVIISQNFEPDNKEEWPKYIRARIIYEEWKKEIKAIRNLALTDKQKTEIRRKISKKYAISTQTVRKFVIMMEVADEFENYHKIEKKRDLSVVKHRSTKVVEYFDELSKSKDKEYSVYWWLNKRKKIKNVIFDLLYDGKIQEFKNIRKLKYVCQHDESQTLLMKAHSESDPVKAQRLVTIACDTAENELSQQTEDEINSKVKMFVDWFRKLPNSALNPMNKHSISSENLSNLKNVLRRLGKET